MSRFIKIFVKKVWIAGLIFLLILIAGFYLLRRETYVLNKNVRLVGMRINRFEELSLHRQCRYKMQFQTDDYQVYLFLPGPTNQWKDVVTYRYEDAIETSTPGFAIEIDRGEIVSFGTAEDEGKARSHLILRFCTKKTPSAQSGILFIKNGDWRILQRFSGVE